MREAGRPVLRRFPILLALALSQACVPAAQGPFLLEGTASASYVLQRKAEQPNSVLFIVALNAGGVPVAVKRVLNPKFPLRYALEEADLVLPGSSWRGPLTLKAYLNTHGQVGVVLHGDGTGTHQGPVQSGQRDADIRLDQQA